MPPEGKKEVYNERTGMVFYVDESPALKPAEDDRIRFDDGSTVEDRLADKFIQNALDREEEYAIWRRGFMDAIFDPEDEDYEQAKRGSLMYDPDDLGRSHAEMSPGHLPTGRPQGYGGSEIPSVGRRNVEETTFLGTPDTTWNEDSTKMSITGFEIPTEYSWNPDTNLIGFNEDDGYYLQPGVRDTWEEKMREVYEFAGGDKIHIREHEPGSEWDIENEGRAYYTSNRDWKLMTPPRTIAEMMTESWKAASKKEKRNIRDTPSDWYQNDSGEWYQDNQPQRWIGDSPDSRWELLQSWWDDDLLGQFVDGEMDPNEFTHIIPPAQFYRSYPDTIDVLKGNWQHGIGELSHAMQYIPVTEYEKWNIMRETHRREIAEYGDKFEDVGDSLDWTNVYHPPTIGTEPLAPGQTATMDIHKSTLESEAHSVNEAKLWRKYKTDNPGYTIGDHRFTYIGSLDEETGTGEVDKIIEKLETQYEGYWDEIFRNNLKRHTGYDSPYLYPQEGENIQDWIFENVESISEWEESQRKIGPLE